MANGTKLEIVVEPVNKGSLINAFIYNGETSFSLGCRKNDLESWISWKTWLYDLANVIGAEIVDKRNNVFGN
jgi:hypothetical protein